VVDAWCRDPRKQYLVHLGLLALSKVNLSMRTLVLEQKSRSRFETNCRCSPAATSANSAQVMLSTPAVIDGGCSGPSQLEDVRLSKVSTLPCRSRQGAV
jgi:hypothetical protein